MRMSRVDTLLIRKSRSIKGIAGERAKPRESECYLSPDKRPDNLDVPPSLAYQRHVQDGKGGACERERVPRLLLLGLAQGLLLDCGH